MNSYTILVKLLDEAIVEAKRLGRHVEHDSRSLWYQVDPDDRLDPNPETVIHQRRIPILDQGKLGSCTGNAAVGACGSEPIFDSLLGNHPPLVEEEAVTIYAAGTHYDNVTGVYPPTDTGSTGLAVAKACQKLGMISGYTHITNGVAGCLKTIQVLPFIIGINWYEGFDNPAVDGTVEIAGQVRGGHEVLVRGYSVQTGMWLCDNSWGPDWGARGSFMMSSSTLERLLGEQGDATVLVPLSAPPPTPTPVPIPPTPPAPPTPPEPVPTPTPDEVDRAFWVQAQNWARAKSL